MSKLPAEVLRHIIDECDLVLATVKEVTKEQFLADKVLVRAVERSVYIIGEATRILGCRFRHHLGCRPAQPARSTRTSQHHA